MHFDDGGSGMRYRDTTLTVAAGVGTFELARYMGTSVEVIERTYGHLVAGADDSFRQRLDAFSARVGVDLASGSEAETR